MYTTSTIDQQLTSFTHEKYQLFSWNPNQATCPSTETTQAQSLHWSLWDLKIVNISLFVSILI